MKIQELITFIKKRVPGVYYPNGFPVSAKTVDECFVVKLTPGAPPDEWTGKKQPSFQILARGKANGMDKVEERAYEVHGSLTNLYDIMIGTDSVTIIRAMNSVPFHIGNDDNNRPMYSMNFECVIRP